MAKSTPPSVLDLFEFPGQANPSRSATHQSTTARPRTPVNRTYDILSPAEAEYAYHGGSVKQSASRLVDSPLQGWDDQPIVSPLEDKFPKPPSFTSVDARTMTTFRGTQLEALEEHTDALVPIFVHLRTNVIVRDEFKLVTKLSTLLSQLYSCSQDVILINVEHSVCLLLGSSFDPAYFLHISTIPEQLSAQANRYNTNEIQKSLQRLLKVPSNRGIVRFQPISGDNVGTRNTTVSELNSRGPRNHLRHTRPQSRGADTIASIASFNNNPLMPSSASAYDVLTEQIASMSDIGGSSIRSGGSSPERHPSPSRDWYDHHHDTYGRPQQRRRIHSDNLLNTTRKTRPVSSHSLSGLSAKRNSSGWYSNAPSTLNGDRQWFDSGSAYQEHSDFSSEEMEAAAAPQVAQARQEVRPRSEKRRSLFNMFRR